MVFVGDNHSKNPSEINFVFLSCHFPPRFRFFIKKLKDNGVNVFGIADETHENLHPEVRDHLAEYYKVSNMDDYDQCYRAVAHFIAKHGRIHYIESFSEHWIDFETELRKDFNVPFGYRPKHAQVFKKKSGMKSVFTKAGLTVAPGILPASLEEALEFAKKTGYPLILKPDVGVGACGTIKVHNEDDLRKKFDLKENQFLEKFITGTIETYDGLTDANGNIVFHSTMGYSSGIMDILHGVTTSMFYWCKRDVPEDLKVLGEKVVRCFDVKSRFFHAEFFRTADGTLLPLEINIRPPGGMNLDMWNFIHEMDIFNEYARIITGKPVTAFKPASCFAGYSGRRNHWNYKITHDEIVKTLGRNLRYDTEMPSIFSSVMGNYAYVFTAETFEQLREYNRMVEERV